MFGADQRLVALDVYINIGRQPDCDISCTRSVPLRCAEEVI